MLEIKQWKDVYLENYNGISDEAKELEPFLKSNYKGNIYIPWATMERLVFMSDPSSTFNVVKDEDGNIIHTETQEVVTYNSSKDEVKETKATMFSHFVKVSLIFMGKYFEDYYPVQSNTYEAVKVYNQNDINKALQRAKTRLGARATGLGLKLYEGHDLQFDEVKEEVKKPTVKKEEVKKPTVKKETPKKEEPKEEVKETPKEEIKEVIKEAVAESVSEKVQDGMISETEANNEVDKVVDIILNGEKEKVVEALQRINPAILKKYGFTFNTSDTAEEIAEKLESFADKDKFIKTLEKLVN